MTQPAPPTLGKAALAAALLVLCAAPALAQQAPLGPVISQQAPRAPEPRVSLDEPGPGAPRTGPLFLESAPVSDRIELGLGLFSVRGATTKEREHRRLDPIRDTGARDSKVGGLGMSLRF
jgi:hypothetical protein